MIRLAKRQDLAACREIFRRSVEEIGPAKYTPDQVEIWSAFAGTPEFKEFILGTTTLVKDTDGRILAFAGADATGHIRSLFVDPSCARTGIGAELMAALLARFSHLPTLYTEASDFSRPLFERFGFAAIGTENVAYEGVEIKRHKMQRTTR